MNFRILISFFLLLSSIVFVESSSDQIGNVSIRPCPADGSTDFHKLRSSGRQIVCLNVQGINLTQNSNVEIFYFPGEEDLKFNCHLIALEDSTISCSTDPGFGKNMTLEILIDGIKHIEEKNFMSYMDPEFVEGSIRGSLDSPGSDHFETRDSFGDTIYFDVRNIDAAVNQSFWKFLSIIYYPHKKMIDSRRCQIARIVQSISQPDIFTIECILEDGYGSDFELSISALNANSKPSVFTLAFPKTPIVLSVETEDHQCLSTDKGSIESCSTSGDQLITINGANFCKFSPGSKCSVLVTIGPNFCRAPLFISENRITCFLPPGTGVNLPVSIHQSESSGSYLMSKPRFLVSYASPVIEAILGCTDSLLHSRECSRESWTKIEVTGKNFGSSDAIVLIGLEECANVSHSVNAPHSKLSCMVPPGRNIQEQLVLFQKGGLSSNSFFKRLYNLCLPGTRVSGIDSSCISCPKGTYSSEPGSKYCTLCPAGTFSFENSSECLRCPRNEQSVAPQDGLASCIRCPNHSIANEERTKCICDAGYFSTTAVDDLDSISIECHRCPAGTLCGSSGVELKTLQIQNGWWRLDRNSSSIYPCGAADHCLFSAQEAQTCGEGRSGVLCAHCIEGYDSFGSDCRFCDERDATLNFVIMTLLFLGLVFIYYAVLKMDKHHMHLLKHRQALQNIPMDLSADIVIHDDINLEHFEDPSIEGSPPAPPNFVYKLKILLGFFQVVVTMVLYVEMPWPSVYKSFIVVFNIVNLDYLNWSRLGCVVRISYFTKRLISILLPFGYIALIFLLFLVPKWISKRIVYSRNKHDQNILREEQSRFSRAKRKCIKMILFTLFLVYPMTSANIFKLYDCRTVNDKQYLIADTEILCGSNEWFRQATLNILFIVAIPFGTPLIFATMLFKYRKRLHEPAVLVTVGFLYGAYHVNNWWFEIVDILYKLAITSALIVLPPDYRLRIGMVVVIIYLGICLQYRPFLRKGDDRLNAFVQVEIFVLLLASQVYQTIRSVDKPVDNTMSAILIMLTAGIFVYIIAQIISNAKKMSKKRKLKKRARSTGSEIEQRVQEVRYDRRLTGVRFMSNPIISPVGRSISMNGMLATSIDMGVEEGHHHLSASQEIELSNTGMNFDIDLDDETSHNQFTHELDQLEEEEVEAQMNNFFMQKRQFGTTSPDVLDQEDD